MPEGSNAGNTRSHTKQSFWGIALNILLVISLVALGIVAWLRLPRWVAWAESLSSQSQNNDSMKSQAITATNKPSI